MRTAVFGTVIILLFLLAGCDSYSILDQFSKSSDTETLSLTLQKTSILRGEAIDLNPAGGTKPYTFAVIAEDLYAGTAKQSIGSVVNQRFTAGGAIGKIAITVIDATGKRASASVIVLPPAPTDFIVTGRNTNTVSLSWAYAEPSIINGFLLISTDKINPAQEYPQNSNIFTTSIPAQNTTTYSISLYAVSGAYSSLPLEITSAP